MPTIPTKPAPEPSRLTADELMALHLTAQQLDVIAAYQSFCGGSLVSWAAKLLRAA